MKYMEYKNGYLLTNEEHDKAVKHKHLWDEDGECLCGAFKVWTQFGERIYIAMAPQRMARLLVVEETEKFSIFGACLTNLFGFFYKT